MIDVFIKCAWVKPLKSKKAKTVVNPKKADSTGSKPIQGSLSGYKL